jgi:hypothetical protein
MQMQQVSFWLEFSHPLKQQQQEDVIWSDFVPDIRTNSEP